MVSFRSRAFCVVLALLVVLSAGSSSPAAPPPRGLRAIRPGPRQQSDEERALTLETSPDPSTGGVILVDETCRDRSREKMRIRRHVRSKVLSETGLGLARIQVSPLFPGAQLVDFWAVAIRPDGSVEDLSREDLVRRSAPWRDGKGSRTVLEGTIPGVVPGTVLDWGYELMQKRGLLYRYEYWTPLADWPTLRRVSEWLPGSWNPFAWYVQVGRDLDVKVVPLGRAGVRVEARNLPPLRREDWLPPFPLGRDVVIFYYQDEAAKDARQYWIRYARDVAATAEAFLRGSEKALARRAREILAARGLDESAPDEDRARAIYDRVRTAFRNREAGRLDVPNAPVTSLTRPRGRGAWSARAILDRMEGTARETDYLAWALLRAAKVPVRLVAATETSAMAWVPSYMNRDVFTGTLLAVHLRDGKGAPRQVFLDPGSGRPWGDLPWVFTGETALLVEDEGFRPVTIPPQRPERNTAVREGRLELDPAAGRLRAEWRVHLAGAVATSWRLEELPAGKRRAIGVACGGSDSVRGEEVAPAAPGDDVTIACEATRSFPPVSRGEIRLSLGGPWWPAVPVFEEASRRAPVFLRFPREERSIVSLEIPPGMVVAELPEEVDLSSPWGRFTVSFTDREGVVYAEAAWRLERVVVPVEDWPRFREWMAAIHAHAAPRIRLVPADDGAGAAASPD